jgi:citrate/tricarballylate utilization protein
MSGSSFDALFAEAERQLTICNACRYCEGYCAVFPALERRRLLTEGDITHLADLCHDCRDCYTACMYAPPHEFGVNPPAVLSAVRRRTYDAYLPRMMLPACATRRARGARLTVVALGVAALAAAVAVGQGSSSGATTAAAGSPYRIVPYPALLAVALLPAVFGVAIMLRGALVYWRDTGGSLRGLISPAALRGAAAAALTMRNLRGGGAGCAYPDDQPSSARRRLHAGVAYGFLACAGSTVAAAISQDIAGDPPPYPLVSAPVLLGVIGGAGLLAGGGGLITLKRRAVPDRADPEMTARDYGLLAGLVLLAATGLLTLALRDTAAFGPVLAVHLAAVVTCFAIAPYTKFMHAVYRFLALVRDSAERRRP